MQRMEKQITDTQHRIGSLKGKQFSQHQHAKAAYMSLQRAAMELENIR